MQYTTIEVYNIDNKKEGEKAMKEITTIYTARFADGTEITKTDRDGIKNRLDMSNWICKNRLGKKHGSLKEITIRTIG